jgi:hypothetical protein
MTFLVAFLVFACAACSSPQTPEPAAEPVPQPSLTPVRLPVERHGHRVERLPGGVLCCGGYAKSARGKGWDDRAVLWLGDGETEWRARAEMPVGRTFFGSAAVDGGIVAIANGIDRYDAAADLWRTCVPAGELPASHFGAAATSETAWVLGGYPLERSAFFEIDLASGKVARQEPPPGFQPGDHFHFVAALDGELHVVGGLDVKTFVARREHWIRRDGRWEAQAPPPAGLWSKFGGCAIRGGRLHLFGDFGHHVYDAAAKTWELRAPLPFPLVMPAAVVLGESIWILGGMRIEGSGPVLLCYDPAADRWEDRGAPR